MDSLTVEVVEGIFKVEEEEEEILQVEENLHGSRKLVILILHVSFDCWYKEKGENQKGKKVVNFSVEDDNNKLFFSTMDDEKSGEIWYLDSGCSNHLTGNQSAFEESDKNYSSHVELGDGRQVKIEGKGVIAVHTSGGYRLFNPLTNQLVLSRDVIFDETASWKWETQEVTEVPMEDLFLEPKESVKDIVGSLRSNYEDDSDSGTPPRRFMNAPSKLHFVAAKMILRYLQGTKTLGIKYLKEEDSKLVGFCDSDWAGSLDDRRSTSAYVFCLGSKTISWSSKKQSSVALSSAEAEYIAANEVVRNAIWLRRILVDLQQKGTNPTQIYCDNQSAISMTKNPVFHARSKHIELRHNYIRDMVQKKEIHLDFIKTTNQPADVLTKAVSIEKLQQFKDMMKITN
ncbi:hypothetical protein ZIOFF_021704 [Zingiber officinale]|uniref:Retrovirus-related Pol polyprotein from transposon TNT 1-94-like beta-barrel domain-containing protein n=1 Tax=Zingiber officinale TaxID=94328 RepID=A0A8J5LH46_ZINOF|nr:hypothetical protein ZIOFF_021704 [Zingiber officinale]